MKKQSLKFNDTKRKAEAMRPVVLRTRTDNGVIEAIPMAQASFETSQCFIPLDPKHRTAYLRFELLNEMLHAGQTIATNKATYKLDGAGVVGNVTLPTVWQTIQEVFPHLYEQQRLSIYTQAIGVAAGRIDEIAFPVCRDEHKELVTASLFSDMMTFELNEAGKCFMCEKDVIACDYEGCFRKAA